MSATVRIVFETPTRTGPVHPENTHHRDIDRVPESVAQKMVDDYEQYNQDPSPGNRQRLYTYETSGVDQSPGEALVALDFDEVSMLTVTNDDGPLSSAA